MSQPDKQEQIEILRGFAILTVLFGHTIFHFLKNKQLDFLTLFNLVLDVAAHYAVPLFILISGYVLALNHPLPVDLRKFYAKRGAAVLPPYLLFSLIFMVPHIYKAGQLPLLYLLEKIVTFRASFHLWFFSILLMFYLFYPLLRKAYDYYAVRFRLKTLVVAAAAVQLAWWLADAFLPRDNWAIDAALIYTRFCGWLVYFFCGMLFCSYKETVATAIGRNSGWLATFAMAGVALLSAIWTGERYYGINLVVLKVIRPVAEAVLYSAMLALFLALAARVEKTGGWLKGVLVYCGNYSFGLYLVHIGFLSLFEKFVAPAINATPATWSFYLVLFPFMLVPSVVVVWLISLLPYHWLLIGKVSRKPFATAGKVVSQV